MRELTFYNRNAVILYRIVEHLEKLGFKPGNPYTLSVVNEYSVDDSGNPYDLIGTPYTNKVVVYDDGLKGAYYVIRVWGDPSDKVPIETLMATNTRQEVFELIDSLYETKGKTMRELTFYTRSHLILRDIVEHLEQLNLNPDTSYTLSRINKYSVEEVNPYDLVGTDYTNRVVVYNDGLRGAYRVTQVRGDGDGNQVPIEMLLRITTQQELFETIDNLYEAKYGTCDALETTIAPRNTDVTGPITIYLNDGSSMDFDNVTGLFTTDDAITFTDNTTDRKVTFFKSALQGYSITN